MEMEKKEHWEKVYATKDPHEVSWTQEEPTSSLRLIQAAGLPKSASIIDIGGGDSRLVDYLLNEGYEDITVLDIAANALERAKKRLGTKAAKVTWVVSDIVDFKPSTKYDIWHDRAVFHFLTSSEHISTYLQIVNETVSRDLILATFSTEGPLRCSGLDVSQYNTESIAECFKESFVLGESFYEDHLTPLDTKQNFLFAHFKSA
jgi:cyclopropane fatty-acyl-phospholipid synthase-like methyltransferase